MDIKQVATTILTSNPTGTNDLGLHPSLRSEHISEMLTKIISGEIVGEKAHRWLGWVQCSLLARGLTTLEEMKEMNR